MGTGGHDPFFGADHLFRIQLTALGAVCAAGLYGRLEQFDSASLLSFLVWYYYTTIRRPFPLFFCTTQTVRDRKASHIPQAAAAERVRAF